ncbi:hypothetical protein LCGC14_0763770 [marine sediment metagenome]|uniref:Uncharacterized protein n=1 Tax=marine sediment metagenome TaxID=412755 RepID=A0A0F9T7F4_9ZZZZ
MSAKTITRITTEDTKKTYEFPNEGNPQLWAVTLSIEGISSYGRPEYGSECKEIIHIEQKTLENAGLLPKQNEKKEELQEETAEDLILRLLEHVGVYPVE